jgi:hypothetical protein
MKIRRSFATSSITALLIFSAGCAPFAAHTPAPLPASATPTPIVPGAPTLVPSLTSTATSGPFLLNLTPRPSATALATLVLPASPSVRLDMQVWDGLPTYPGESQPDFYFRLRYDPAAWALTTDQFGYPVLASRNLAGCLIGPSAGRGLPLSGSVDHDVRGIGDLTYQISRASVGGVMQFATYAGGDGRIFTSFEVTPKDQADACIQAAEAVLGTLRSVPLSEATPVAP